jgi:hypothetical protein
VLPGKDAVASKPKILPLTQAEVRERLLSCKDNVGVVDELYQFGDMLLHDAISRLSAMDGKATALGGYAGGIITLLLSTSRLWSDSADKFSTSIIVAAGLLSLLAGACATYGMTLQKPIWFTSNEWIRKEVLGTRDSLRRYHILAMWSVIESHHERCRAKIRVVRVAQVLIALTGVLLTVAFLEIAWNHTSFKSLIVQGWQVVRGWL